MQTVKKKLVELAIAPTERVILQVPRAVLASVPAGAVDFGTLVLLVKYAGWNAVAAAVVSYLVGGVVQYTLCAVWVFPHAPKNTVIGFTAFSILSLVGLGITGATMSVLHGLIGIHYAVAKLVALALAFCWNFLSRRYLIFRSPIVW